MNQKRKLNDGDKLKPQVRHVDLRVRRTEGESERSIIEAEERTLDLSFSSEQPVERWWGNEVLSHEAGAADLSRLNDGAPLLFNHNMDDVIGVVEKAWMGNDRRGYARVRFARTPRADEVVGMINDGILRNVSFMYDVDRLIATEMDDAGDVETYTATAWRVYEISIVTVPADQSIGIGRAWADEEKSVHVERKHPAAAAVTSPTEEPMKRKHIVMDKASDGTSGGGGGHVATVDPVDMERVRKEARQEEQERIRSIEELCTKHSIKRDIVQDMIAKGRTIAEARGIVLDLISEGGAKPVANFDHQRVDMTDKESRSWSLVRAVRAALTQDWSQAGFEREVSIEIAKTSGKSHSGSTFFMPSNIPFAPTQEHMRAWRMAGGGRRAAQYRAPYVVGTAGQGGNLVATDLLAESFIEVLRNTAVLPLLGARFLPGLVGKVDIPRQITTTSTYWVGESGALTESEATFDKVSLSPKTIGALSLMSRLMLLQATPAIEMLAREDMLAQMALGVDLAGLSGSGSSNQPTGIVNQSGVNSVVGGTNGANLTFDHIIQLRTAVKKANAPQSNLGFALNSSAIGYLSTLKSTTGSYLWESQGGLTNDSPDRLKGYSYAESQQLRSNLTKGTASGICSELIFGNWRELLIGEWGTIELMVNPFDSTGFTKGDVLVRSFQTLDIAARHGASFAVMSDALTPGF